MKFYKSDCKEENILLCISVYPVLSIYLPVQEMSDVEKLKKENEELKKELETLRRHLASVSVYIFVYCIYHMQIMKYFVVN